MIDLRRRTVTFGLAAAVVMPPRPAWAESAKVTFILTNDIYQMGDTLMADGQRRGGFARLAAVVKAERAKGGHVVFAHGGDTLSPSLMSGVDQGAHIIALTNMLKPDIFVPGNHEFDFGKAVFLKRMAEAKFPVFAANMPGPDGRPLPGIKDRDIVTFDGVRIGLTGAAHDGTPRMSNSEDLKFLPTVATMKAQAEALRRDGVDLVVVVMHADRKQGVDLVETHAADLILTGHNHDLFIQFDGRTADGRVGLRRALRHGDRPAHRDEAAGQPARGRMVAAVPRGRHRDGDAGPRGRGHRGGLPAGAGPPDERAARRPPRSRSTAATPPCAAARPRSAISSPTRCASGPAPTSRS